MTSWYHKSSMESFLIIIQRGLRLAHLLVKSNNVLLLSLNLSRLKENKYSCPFWSNRFLSKIFFLKKGNSIAWVLVFLNTSLGYYFPMRPIKFYPFPHFISTKGQKGNIVHYDCTLRNTSVRQNHYCRKAGHYLAIILPKPLWQCCVQHSPFAPWYISLQAP